MSIVPLLIFFLSAACSRTPLGEYQPRNQTEEEIKTVIVEYLDAKRRFDIVQYLAGLHNQGRFHFECGRIVSKAELGQLLPGFWAGMRSGDPTFYPINRECITGDYFDSGQYVDPRITMAGDRAEVTLTFTDGWWGLEHYVSLIKENDCWVISRLDWEMN